MYFVSIILCPIQNKVYLRSAVSSKFFVLVQVQLLEPFPFLEVELDPSIWIMWHVGVRSPDLLTVPVLDSIITTVATRKMLASLANVSILWHVYIPLVAIGLYR